MKNTLYILFSIVLLNSCAINQDYYFEDNGEVKMDVSVDMSGLFKSLPEGENGSSKFGNIQDSLDASHIEDSLKAYGLSKFEANYDSINHILTVNMAFDKLDNFVRFMNKDRDVTLKPIEIEFSKSQFKLKNTSGLMSAEMMKGLGGGKPKAKSEEKTDNMDMSNFLTFSTTYHFPYEVESFKSGSGDAMLAEDKKSISFNNKMNDFYQNSENDFDVKFK